ncbi:MAG: hypothetical protein HY774_04250 [Acidobacteria bacterium]|nr:hypothetical protein [Acidobacteriota bacterium]
MKLYFLEKYLGEVVEEGDDFPWKIGLFSPNSNADSFKDFFAYMVSEDVQETEPPFSAELLDDESWFLVDDSNQRHKISVPAIHPDNSIWWIWRPF